MTGGKPCVHHFQPEPNEVNMALPIFHKAKKKLKQHHLDCTISCGTHLDCFLGERSHSERFLTAKRFTNRKFLKYILKSATIM
jgi:hypothetical protein